MKIELVNFILQGWPEATAVIFLSISILQKEFPVNTILKYGFLLAFVTWLVRILPIPFGIHTLTYCLVLMFILYKMVKTPFSKTLYTVFIALFILVFAETLVHALYGMFFGNVSYSDGWLWVFIGWPQIIIITALALLIKKLSPRFTIGKVM